MERAGARRSRSGVTRSGARDGCTLSMKTIGVAWVDSVGQVEADVDFHALYSLFGTVILTSRSAIVGSVTVGQRKQSV